MVVDFLRSCYRRPCVFVTPDGQRLPIRWFFAAPGAKLFPLASTFGSYAWEIEHLEGIGENPGPQSWDKGRNPGYPGTSFVGDPAWFLTGLPAEQLTMPINALTCGRPTIWPFGGCSTGGVATYAVSGLGGVEIDGAGLASQPTVTVGLGGVELSGSADAFQAPVVVGLGGVELDGAGLASQLPAVVGLGGVELDGAGLASQVELTVGQGGVEVDGAAESNTGVFTACCPMGIPTNLRVIFAVLLGNTCLDGQEVAIVWNGSTWSGSASLCGTTVSCELECLDSGSPSFGDLRLTITCGSDTNFTFPQGGGASSCDPFHLFYGAYNVGDVCDAVIEIVVEP